MSVGAANQRDMGRQRGLTYTCTYNVEWLAWMVYGFGVSNVNVRLSLHNNNNNNNDNNSKQDNKGSKCKQRTTHRGREGGNKR